MSDYYDVAMHPDTGRVCKALWVDGAYGCHSYGVKFLDGNVYPAEEVVRVDPCSLFDEVVNLRQYVKVLEEHIEDRVEYDAGPSI